MTAVTDAPLGSGFCPVCGGAVQWIPTSHLWPSRRAAREVLTSQSGTCSSCGRVLMFTVLNEPAGESGGEPA